MPALGSPIVLDGSFGEGGPTLVRTALSLAALTQQALRIENVRGGMPQPGLRAEDIAMAKVLAVSTSAEMVGAEPGSRSLSFLPTRLPRPLPAQIEPSEDRDGPGSLSAPVLLCALLPVAARTGVINRLSVLGETFGQHVLGFDAFSGSVLQALKRFGLYAQADILEAGFGRLGRGQINVEVEPSFLEGVRWDSRGKVVQCRAVVSYAEVGEDVPRRGIAHLTRLGHHAGMQIETEALRLRSKTPGVSVTVMAEYERGFGSATAMGAKGLRIESVVQNAFDQFLQWVRSDATVDAFLADQLLVTAAMAESETLFRVQSVTPRLQTAVWVVKQFLPIHLTLRGQLGEPGIVSVRR